MKKYIKATQKKISPKIRKNPIASFLAILIILFGIIAITSSLNKPITEDIQKTKTPIPVQTYILGETNYITIPATVEKNNITTIYAQTSGIITNLNVQVGQKLNKYSPLIDISQTYTGANSASINRQIAQKNAQNAQDNLEIQTDIINRQKEIANQSLSNSNQLREIYRQSKDASEDLLDQNQSILDQISTDIDQLEATNSAGVNEQIIRSNKQIQSQYQATINTLRTSISTNQLQGDDDRPPARLAEEQRNLTHKQLELQQSSIELQAELAQLQLQLAQVQEAAYHPVSPTKATVQQIHVSIGQTVSPGTPLLTIASDNNDIKITALTSAEIAKNITVFEPSILNINNNSIPITPLFISTEATQGQLHAITYILNNNENLELKETSTFNPFAQLTNNQSINIQVPINQIADTVNKVLIPIDAVFQTQTSNTVFLVNNNQAQSQEIKLGNVYGSFVEVIQGLSDQDLHQSGIQTPGIIILNRNIIQGDPIQILN